MAAEGAEEVRAKQAGGKEGGNGGQLSHSTWHVRGASPASRANGASARAGVTQQNRPPSAPTSPGSASKKSGFNMKVGEWSRGRAGPMCSCHGATAVGFRCVGVLGPSPFVSGFRLCCGV